jgi:acyl-CoA synthetase (AMP-forming)/AMP-acid ligase II
LPQDLADAVLPRVQELWNLYGPTETTIWSTAERVLPGSDGVSIGRPIANTQVYVLDRTGQPAGIGVPGEIWIGGAGVAIGYHRQPDLTAERFVPDRFSTKTGARLYRTGDVGRWGTDGRLYHLGRSDHQVKVRGFRIELGEIERVLCEHPAVRQAVVIARDARPNDSKLIAYVVYQGAEEPTVSEVRGYLRRRLPDYMVPSIVVALTSVPMTPNGKVDRKALPDPFRNAERAASYEPPTSGLEQAIAGIWRDFLKVEQIGAQDNFFELGGHSLLSLRVARAIEKQTGWQMDPRSLFFQSLRQVASGARRHAEGGA